MATGEIHQVTDGLSDATFACFSRDGQYLFFAASTNYGLNTGWLDMSSYERDVKRSLVCRRLEQRRRLRHWLPKATTNRKQVEKTATRKTMKTSLMRSSSDEKDGKKDKDKKKEPVEVKIDFEGLSQRILALPVPARDYGFLQAGKDKLFYLEQHPYQFGSSAPPLYTLHTFDMKERKSETFLDNVRAYWLSADGKKLLYRGKDNGHYAIIDANEKPKIQRGEIETARTWRSTSSHRQSGRRCSMRFSASSAIISTTRICTAQIGMASTRSTSPFSRT